MSCYPETESQIRDKVKVILDLSNCSIKIIRTCCRH